MEAWSIYNLSGSIFQFGIDDFLLLVYHAKKKIQWGKYELKLCRKIGYIYTP
jgi:hypothetical protein